MTDAIVCYAWTGDLLQVAVARTSVPEGNGNPPEWFVIGKPPVAPAMKIFASDRYLKVHDDAVSVLWEIADTDGELVWPRQGVFGTLPSQRLHEMHPRSVATDRIRPEDVGDESITVTTPIVNVRSGMSVCKGPEGFRQRSLLVMDEDGTWSMEPVWVGDQLVLATTEV